MPGFDGTGPLGYGPMTGGGFGYCNPAYRGYYSGAPLYGVGRGGIPWGGGRGRAFGGGRGRFGGWGFPYSPAGYNPLAAPGAMPASSEKEYLENTIAMLREDIQSIEERLNELKAAEKKK